MPRTCVITRAAKVNSQKEISVEGTLNPIIKTHTEQIEFIENQAEQREQIDFLKKEIDFLKKELEKKIDIGVAIKLYAEEENKKSAFQVFKEVLSDIPEVRYTHAIGLNTLSLNQLSKKAGYPHSAIVKAIKEYRNTKNVDKDDAGKIKGGFKRLMHFGILDINKKEYNEYSISLSKKGRIFYAFLEHEKKFNISDINKTRDNEKTTGNQSKNRKTT